MWIHNDTQEVVDVFLKKFGVKTCYCKVRDLTSATLEGDKVELGQ